jgi:hypothetical protein
MKEQLDNKGRNFVRKIIILNGGKKDASMSFKIILAFQTKTRPELSLIIIVLEVE